VRACDNVSSCHTPFVIADGDAMRVICETCKRTYIIRKDPNKGVPEMRQYQKIFKKDTLQGNDNLLYKYHEELMRT
jgi:hypothetical protein